MSAFDEGSAFRWLAEAGSLPRPVGRTLVERRRLAGRMPPLAGAYGGAMDRRWTLHARRCANS